MGGCSSPGAGPPADAAELADAAGLADALPGHRVGRVLVRTYLDLASAQSGTYVQAEFGIDALPSRTADDRLTAVMTAGDCRLLAEQPPACDPPCTSDWACMADGTCRYNNFGVDAGAVAVDGLQRAVELRFDQGYGDFDDASLFSAGDAISADAPGGTWPGGTAAGFDIAGTAPEDLDVAIDGGVLPLDDTAGATLTWTASTRPDARYALRIATPHGHAGASDQVLACEGPDTGQVTIAAELIAAFPPLEVPNCWGLTCVPAELSRYTQVTSPTSDGEVSLVIGSLRSFWADHPAP